MKRNSLIGLGSAVAVLLACSFANAELIPLAISGVTGDAYHVGDGADPGDGSWSRVLDGTGLTVGDVSDPSTWTHNARWQDNWQGQGSYTGGNTPGAWFTADLGSIYTDLAKLYVWNVREVLDRGMKDVDIFYSDTTFPPTSWSLLGSYTIPQATGDGTPADAIIDLSSIPSARYIGLDIHSNYGSTFRVGVAEMQFTVVPEPASALLGGLALAAIGFVVRRRA
ncbi:MAG: PEP-CTERM sorting domain-containing protein [Planctomycetales bacterium]|nr:PEP-CTERM sorting domain-containing protein [Planctomycetales bacterium]